MIEGIDLARDFNVSLGLLRGKATLRAVDHVSLHVAAGETVALVGESGSGKSTLGRMLLGLLPPSAGEVRYEGQPLRALRGADWRRYRADVQAVFQDTSASLNPRRVIADAVAAPLRFNLGLGEAAARQQAGELLQRVGLDPAVFARRYPHQLSGGQRQRVGLARALASRPRLIVADEPVSALDVSVRAQALKLMIDLQAEMNLAMLFITHDLGVARWIARRVVVMYLGALVEEGPAARVFAAPRHPYTRALIAAAPVPDPERPRPERLLRDEIPSPLAPPSGCRFHPRCPLAQAICKTRVPERLVLPEPADANGAGERIVACHFASETQES
ncbi:MAG: ABC transporter ATP-binding protein [Thermoflexales bacterium]|nr:ABC transporter ATP-binding protein [Thermoflexales bacterium]